MKIIMKLTCAVFAIVILALGVLTANAAPGDLIAADDYGHGNIYQLPISPSFGTPSLYWDNSNRPPHAWTGIAFDQAGNLYASDPGSGVIGEGTIWKLPPDRTGWTLFATGLNGPAGLAVDAAGNLYVAERDFAQWDEGGNFIPTSRIHKFTPDAVRTTFASGLYLLNEGGINMVFDSHGNLLVPSGNFGVPPPCQDCPNNGFIYEISPAGAPSTFATLPFSFFPRGIALDSAGNFFAQVANGLFIHDQYILKSPGQWDPPAHAFAFASNIALVVDTAGNVYGGGSSPGATVTKYPSDYPGHPAESIYIGIGNPLQEHLGQLAVQPPAYAAQVQPPINADGTSIFNARRGVISVRFRLTYGGAATCALPPATIAVTRTAGGVTGEVNESVYTGAADTGSNFRINGCQYMYNLDPRSLGVGIYRADIKIYGGTVGSATFELR